MKTIKKPITVKKTAAASRILLVDDDDIFRSEFKELFQDYGVREASNGQEALNILKKPNEIDLVMLDVRMPGLNGIEVLERIKQIAPDVYTIISTGYSSKDVAIEALKAKADNYLEKPFEPSRVKEIIDEVLDGKQAQDTFSTDSMEAKVEKIKRFAERNCYKKISLSDAAEIACLSPKYLSRIFKQYCGKGFSEFRLEIKIGKAKELLIQSACNIDQISDKLGYQNTESFIRQFKKFTRCTPTEYRKKTQKQNNAKKSNK
jgi:two-component system, response regulator YesN